MTSLKSMSGHTFGVHDDVVHCSIDRRTMLANQRGERRIGPSLMHKQMYKNRAMDNNTSPIEDLFMASTPNLCPRAA